MKENTLPGFDKLALLETFDPHAFLSNDEKEQKVCKFVLALALIYNDFKNLSWGHKYLRETEPQDRNITAYNGQYGGFEIHVIRLLYSLLRELFKLIENNSESLKHPLFIKIEKQLSKEVKKYWQSLVDFSIKKCTQNKKLKELFERVRNKIGYHPDAEEIFTGYKSFFFNENNNIKMDAYISRGYSLEESRFYFADAGIQKYLEDIIGEDRENFFNEVNEVCWKVSNVLYEIVTKFVNARGFCWRNVKS